MIFDIVILNYFQLASSGNNLCSIVVCTFYFFVYLGNLRIQVVNNEYLARLNFLIIVLVLR